jgi:beta-glucosidase
MTNTRSLSTVVSAVGAVLGLAMLGSACSHPSVGTGAGGGGGNGIGNGGAAGGIVNTGPMGGKTGEIILPPPTDGGVSGADAGVDAAPPPPPVKVACGSATAADLTAALDYTRPYAVTPAITTEVNRLFGTLSDNRQKADQMRGTVAGNTNYDSFETPNTTSVKGLRFRDGPRGVNLDAKLTGGSGFSTAFPAAIARGASWDLDLEYQIGQAIGDETLASGNTMILAPTVNILRHPAWGRAQETYGEDPFHLGRLGTAFTVGVQEFIPACAKHYAANNIENGRETAHAQMDEQTLREMYARHFGMIIKDGGLACVMAAYNLLGVTAPAPALPDQHCTQSSHLITDILRTDFQFKGFVLTDWWAMPNAQNFGLVASDPNGLLQTTAREAVNAGLDMELPWSLNYSRLEALVSAGGSTGITQAQLDTSVKRILEQKARFNVQNLSGMLGKSVPTTTLQNNSIAGNEAHVALAQKAAVKSAVLLKNDNNALPITLGTGKTLAILGATVTARYGNGNGTTVLTDTTNFASEDPIMGTRTGDRGSSRINIDPAKTTSPAHGIAVAARAKGMNVVFGSAASAAASADFVVVIAGLTVQDEGEEYTGAGDRTGTSTTGTTPMMALDAKNSAGAVQNPLISAAAALGKPMAVILEGGSVIDLPWLASLPATSAVVMAWYPGQDGGTALGRLLFHADDNANFGGKLPITWPANINDEPQFSGGTTTLMDYYLGYRWFDNRGTRPLFAFGYGLSYSKFTYSNLVVPCSDVNKDGIVKVTVDVRNSGPFPGEEVVFLFASYPGNTTRKAIVKELKGFHRTSLLPVGGGARVEIQLRVSDLKYWDSAAKNWADAKGQVKLWVGGSSDTATLLSDTFTVN